MPSFLALGLAGGSQICPIISNEYVLSFICEDVITGDSEFLF